MNIENLNQLLKEDFNEDNIQEFPLNFAKQLNNNEFNLDLLNQINKDGWNSLMVILRYNKYEELGFNKNEILEIINKYPEQLKQVDKNGCNPLMVILSNNKNQELGLKKENIIDIIKLYPEQLLNIDKEGWNPLMYILRYNKTQELGLKNKDIIDIIKLYPEQLLNIDKEGWNPLMFILRFNKTNEIGLSMEYINKLYEQQIDKNYNNIDYYNNPYNILFNEEYILNKLIRFNNLTYFHEFLDYRKIILEKQKINNILEINQKEIKNTSIFSSIISKI